MSRYERWERVTSLPLTLAAVVFLAAYAVPIVWPDLPSYVSDVADRVSWTIWALYVVDFVVRLGLVPDRRRFLATNWLDLFIIALPLLRPLRLLRLVTVFRFLDRKASDGLRGKVVTYVVGAGALLWFVGALAELQAERASQGATIRDFGDAAWWAMSTMTTVGYGDRYPTTGTGRLIAVAMMVGGIGILGTVTATVASWMMEHVQEATTPPEAEILRELAGLRAEVQHLRQALDGSRTLGGSDFPENSGTPDSSVAQDSAEAPDSADTLDGSGRQPSSRRP